MAEYKAAPVTDPDEVNPEVEEDKAMSCGDKCAQCCTNFGIFLHHDDKYCGQSCGNWGNILFCYALLYICTGIFTWAMLEATQKHPITTLWTFFGIFILVFVGVVAGVIYGHLTRKEEEDDIE